MARLAGAQQQAHDTGDAQHAQLAKSGGIAMLLYPDMTALDLIGPQQVFGYLSPHVHLVAKTKDLVVTDTGVAIQPSAVFADFADPLDLLFVGGGSLGSAKVMRDADTINFLSRCGKTAKLVTSVCTGSMILGAAGLLRGYKATSHWGVRDLLPLLGAELVVERVVQDRNRITAGGITAGIDFGLRVAAQLFGEDNARVIELALEYEPQPPWEGNVEKAPPNIAKAARAALEPLHAAFRESALAARKTWAA
ncbi:MAG TPA: DJ-1/PfpI family protein [Thermoanaerobaculia bacterium]